MADNKKMRKFEGTCYIPGEQLAMMAKYYRGANLNLNLTLVEDEGIMKESLDSSCWCSKLDDVDRMKLRHMKGDAWAISHEHHLGGDHANTMDRGSMNCCFGVGKSPKDMKGELEARVDKGTDTMSLYNHPPRRAYDPRFDVWRGPQPMQDHYDGDRNFRRKESQRRGFLLPYNIDDNKPNHNIHAYYATKSQSNDYYNTHQYRRTADHDMEDDIASRYTAEESDNDIKCMVCKKDVCAVCKNPIRGWPCHCKCVIPNAGLCNECDMQCEKESGKDDVVSKGQHQPQSETNWSNLMLLLMGSQMFNRSQNTGPSCKCDLKNSSPTPVGDSDSASGSSCSCCSEKVQKIFLYDCAASENKKNKEVKKPTTLSGGESSGCGCCKCSKKTKHVGSRNTHRKLSYSPARRESNDSTQSGESSKSLVEQTNNAEPFATSSKNRPSTSSAKSGMAGRLRKLTTSTKDRQASGKKESVRHSWFRKPLADDDNQSDSSKNDEPNTNKRKRTKQLDDDNVSQSSRKSEEDDGTKKNTKRSPDITNFLVCLPKIKSDLEQLLTKMKDEGQMATNERKVLQPSVPASQPSVPAPQPYLTNVTMRNNVPFITHPGAYAPRPTGLLYQDTGSSFNFHPTRNTHQIYDYSVFQSHNHFSVQRDDYNNINPDVSHQNSISKVVPVVHPLEQEYPSIFYSLHPDEMLFGTPSVPHNNIIRNGCNDRLPWNRLQSNMKQKVTGTNSTFTSTYKPISEMNACPQVSQPSNNSLWECQQIGVTHTKYEDTCYSDPSRQQNAFRAYNNHNTWKPVDQESDAIQTYFSQRTRKQPLSETNATRQVFQSSNNMWQCQKIGATHTECGDTYNVDNARQQSAVRSYNNKNTWNPVDQESFKIPVFTERTGMDNQTNSLTGRSTQGIATKPLAGNQENMKIQQIHQQIGATHTEYEDTYNLDSSRQQSAVCGYNNKNTWNPVDQESFKIPLFTERTGMENRKTISLSGRSTQEIATKALAGKHEKIKIEGSIHVDQKGPNNMSTFNIEGSSKNVISPSEDFDTVKEKRSNNPMQSSESKPISDQFISAIEVNEQLSEGQVCFVSEHEPKQTFDNPNREASVKHSRQITNQSTGPGQFRATSSNNAPSLNSPDGPLEYKRKCHTQTKTTINQDQDAVATVSSKLEDQKNTNTSSVSVKNSSKPTAEENDYRASSVQSLDVVVSSEKTSTKSTSKEDRVAFASQRNESLSETLVRITDNDIVSSNSELKALSPALTVDARFYNLIDQAASISAAADSQGSLYCGVAHSSPPSSEDDTDLSQLPGEYTELLIVAEDKRYCDLTGNSVKNAFKALDVSDERVLNNKSQPQNELDQHREGKPQTFGVNIMAEGSRHMTTLQLAKFNLAQEAIQSMVNNVNEVLASIDSESESNIGAAPSDYEDRERQSFFVHLESVDKRSPNSAVSQTHETIVKACFDQSAHEASTSKKLTDIHDTTNRRIPPESKHSSRVAENVAGPSSFSSNESHIRSPRTLASFNQTISRERKFFVLDSSRSNSSVFTEKLRRSLAQETSSPNLSIVLTPEEHTTRSSCEISCTGSSKKPLKRRSWIHCHSKR